MKKIITMVGTSIFENYFEDNRDDDIRGYYIDLKEKKFYEWEKEKRRIQRLENALRDWIKSNKLSKENISAEVKSLLKLKEELKGDIEIYPLCSDTILSKLAFDRFYPGNREDLKTPAEL